MSCWLLVVGRCSLVVVGCSLFVDCWLVRVVCGSLCVVAFFFLFVAVRRCVFSLLFSLCLLFVVRAFDVVIRRLSLFVVVCCCVLFLVRG